MTAPPAVSVMIPVHNRRDPIARAVDSVLAQTFRDFELIVVDDGSDDGTGEVLAAYGDRLTVIRQERAGVSAARNRGVAASRGPLLAFLDSDDWWLPEKLAAQVEFFRTRPDAALCQTEELWLRNGRRVNPGTRHKKRTARPSSVPWNFA